MASSTSTSKAPVVVTTQLPLKLLAKGKVRDVYDAGIPDSDGKFGGSILFVATDRISAFDVILENVSSQLEMQRSHSL